MNKNKKSQITIFIIIALIIVVSIALVFVLKKPAAQGQISPIENPKAFVQRCVSGVLEETEANLSAVGGLTDTENKLLNGNIKIAYYCYTPYDGVLCVNEHPMLNKEIEKLILDSAKPKVEKCFSELKSQLAGYDYKEEPMEMNIEINVDSLAAKISKKITYTRNGQIMTAENFDTKINSPLWNFISITGDIMNQELNCDCETDSCNADMLKLSLDNPDFKITKPENDDRGEIYSIEELDTGKTFSFALRNCVRRHY